PHIIGKLGKLKITSGIDLEEDNYQLALSTSTNHAIQHEHSLFARFIYPLTQKLQMIAGMRTAGLDGTLTSQNTRMNVKGSAFVNELGISYQLTPLIDLFLRRDGNYRFPKSDENSNTPIGVVGLKTQTGVSYETGININASRFKSNLTFYQL